VVFLENPNDPLHDPPSARKRKKMSNKYASLALEIKLASENLSAHDTQFTAHGDVGRSVDTELDRLRRKKIAMQPPAPQPPEQMDQPMPGAQAPVG
jgi:hypothetical protein